MKNVMKNIILIFSIFITNTMYSVIAMEQTMTIICLDDQKIANVPVGIVQLCGTWKNLVGYMKDSGDTSGTIPGGLLSFDTASGLIEFLKTTVPSKLLNNLDSICAADQQAIEQNVERALSQELSKNSLSLLAEVISLANTSNYCECDIVQRGAQAALAHYVTRADNMGYFSECYDAIMHVLLQSNTEAICYGIKNILINNHNVPWYSKLTLSGHAKSVYSVTYSPDGKHLASGSRDTTIIIWDLHSGNILRNLKDHTGTVSVAYSPDGRSLASGSGDKTVKVWDLHRGNILRNLKDHTGTVYSVAYSPDGRSLASGSDDQTVKIWDLHRGNILRNLKGHKDSVYSVAYSPDGKHLASGSADHSVKVWDLQSSNILRNLEGHTAAICCVAYSPDGKHLASSSNRTIKIWDLQSGNILHNLEGHRGLIRSVAYSPDGKHLVSGSDDKTVKIWDLQRGKLLHNLEGHTAWVYSVAYSLDGRNLASGSRDETIKIWQPGNLPEILSLPQFALYVLLKSNSNPTTLCGSMAHYLVGMDTAVQNGYVRGTLIAQEFQDYEHALAHVAIKLSPEELHEYRNSLAQVYIRGTA